MHAPQSRVYGQLPVGGDHQWRSVDCPRALGVILTNSMRKWIFLKLMTCPTIIRNHLHLRSCRSALAARTPGGMVRIFTTMDKCWEVDGNPISIAECNHQHKVSNETKIKWWNAKINECISHPQIWRFSVTKHDWITSGATSLERRFVDAFCALENVAADWG